MPEETGIELVRFGHKILIGTSAEDQDPIYQKPVGQVDVTLCDYCLTAAS